MSSEWLTKSQIKQRGWTDGAIKTFLGEPETTRKNPHYATAAPMQLWLLSTVRKSETNPDFINWKRKHDLRRQELSSRATRMHQERRSLLMEWVYSLEIQVPKYGKSELYKFAIDNYNDLWASRGDFDKHIYAKYSALDPDFLNRIAVNALLHVLSDYKYHLMQVRGLTGASEARSKLKQKIITSIHQIYPKLAYPGLADWIDKDLIEKEEKPDDICLKIVDAITSFSQKIARYVAKDPKSLYALEWRDVERMMAAIFDELGFHVTLTPSSKDGGKDLILECIVEGKEQSYVVEVKHWRSGKNVGKRYVSDFVKVIAKENRDGGLFLSTFGYSEKAYEVLTEVERQYLKLGEQPKVISLCRTFVKAESGLWKPPAVLSDLLFEGL